MVFTLGGFYNHQPTILTLKKVNFIEKLTLITAQTYQYLHYSV